LWFEIPADKVERAQKFYSALFGWKINKIRAWSTGTSIPAARTLRPDGGMMKRCDPQQKITNYVFVESVNKAAAKVKKLGGKIIMPKTAVPGMGFFAVCMDTEKNVFAVWERK